MFFENLRHLTSYAKKRIIALTLDCTVDTLPDMRMLPEILPKEEGLCFVEPPLTCQSLKKQAIWCESYKLFGRWKFSGDFCGLFFLHQGKIVRLPFRAAFTEETLPWLTETAVMEMEFYIEYAEFEQAFERAGGFKHQ